MTPSLDAGGAGGGSAAAAARRAAARVVAGRLAAAQAAGWRAYAVVDAVAGERVPAVWALLHALWGAGADTRSLYAGPLAESLRFAAPWLVTLRAPDADLEYETGAVDARPEAGAAVPGDGRPADHEDRADGGPAGRPDTAAHVAGALWGHGCALFLLSAAPPDAVRRHLRRLLTVRLRRAGAPPGARPERVHWRFFDPHVWRTTLPALPAPDQVRTLGPVAEVLAEGDAPDWLVLTGTRDVADAERPRGRRAESTWRRSGLAPAGGTGRLWPPLGALPLPDAGPDTPAARAARAAARGEGWAGPLRFDERAAEPARPVMRATTPERVAHALGRRGFAVERPVERAPTPDGAAGGRFPDVVARDPADGSVARVTFHQHGPAAGLPHTVTSGAGRAVRLAHAADGRVAGVALPGGPVVAAATDRDGDVVRVAAVRALENAPAFAAGASDTAGAAGAPGYAVTYARVPDPWAPAGRAAGRKVPARLAHPDGTATAATYDARGRLATSTDRTGAVTRFEWQGDTEHLAAVVDPVGRRTAVERDAEGRLSAVVLPDGRRTAFAADAPDPGPLDPPAVERAWAGEVAGIAQLTHPDGAAVALGLDAFGQVRRVAYADGTAVAYALDPATGAVSSAVRSGPDGAEQARVDLTLDGAGHVVGEAVRVAVPPHDGAAGAAALVASTAGAAVDAAGRLRARTTAFGDTMAYAYDPDGLLAAVTLPARWFGDHGVDAPDDAPAPARTITLWRGPAGEVEAVDWAGELQELRAADPGSGRPVRADVVAPALVGDAPGETPGAADGAADGGAEGEAYAARYDAALLARRTWAYDVEGACTAWHAAWRRAPGGEWAEAGRTLARDAEGRAAGEDDAATGAPVARWTRNAAGDLAGLGRATGRPAGGRGASDLGASDLGTSDGSGTSVTFGDAASGGLPDGGAGDALAWSPVTPGAGGQPAAWGGEALAYDARGRLTRLPAAANAGREAHLTWGEDGALAGALVLGPWDAGARRRAVHRWRYAHDALGRRVRKTDGRRTWTYGWAGAQLLTETYEEAPPPPAVRPPLPGAPEPGPVRRRRTYAWAGDSLTLLAWYDEELGPDGAPAGPGRLYWAQADARGAVVSAYAAVGREAAARGAVPRLVWHATYDAFGAAAVDVAEVAQPWRLLGQYADDASALDTGLHHSLARTYSPHTGHYLSRDPLWPAPGTTPYAYAGHRPWDAADPTGAMPLPLVALGVAAVGGAVVGGVAAALTGRSVLAGAAGGAVAGVVGAGAALAAAAAGITGLAALGLNALGAAAGGVLGTLAEQALGGEALCFPCAFAAGGVGGLLGLVTGGVGRIPAVQRWAGRLGAWLGDSRVGQWARVQAGEIAEGTRAAAGWVRDRAAAAAEAAGEALGVDGPRVAMAGAGGGAAQGGGRTAATNVLRSEAADAGVGGGPGGRAGGGAGRNAGGAGDDPPFSGKLRGSDVEMPGVRTERVSYTKRDRAEYQKLRSAFDSRDRANFVKGLADDPSKAQALRDAGLTDADLRTMRAGGVPDGWDVHHKLPIDDGGTNAVDNLVLIEKTPSHRVFTNEQLRLTRGMQPGDTRVVDFPVPDGFVYPPRPGLVIPPP